MYGILDNGEERDNEKASNGAALKDSGNGVVKGRRSLSAHQQPMLSETSHAPQQVENSKSPSVVANTTQGSEVI